MILPHANLSKESNKESNKETNNGGVVYRTPAEAIARANMLIEQLRARTLPPLWERNITKEEWNNLKQ